MRTERGGAGALGLRGGAIVEMGGARYLAATMRTHVGAFGGKCWVGT